jgi:dTDP-4-dehydrorhamnose 3,5-epimerase
MKFDETPIEGLFVIVPDVHRDERGAFSESYKKSEFRDVVGDIDFVQDNESISKRGVLRGLHYQAPPFAQAKLVRVTYGEVFDVAVDLRRDSKTFGRFYATQLSMENRRQMFIPRGFAHGFLTLSERAVFSYKVDAPYSQKHERGIRYDDERLGIPWPVYGGPLLVSARDQEWPGFNDAVRDDELL